MKSGKIFKIVIAIALCEAVGGIGAILTGPVGADAWYQGLNRSVLNPPNWVFSVVWTLLFALMGVAAYLIWEKKSHDKTRSADAALEVLVMQMVLNILWSILFFVLHDPIAALCEMFALWLAIAWLVCRASLVSRLAGWLLLPYLLWVSFAIYLNYSIVLLN